MPDSSIVLPFGTPIAPQLAFAVLRLEAALEQGVMDELGVNLEAAAGVMRRVATENAMDDRSLVVEVWPWEQVQEMVEAVQAARDAAASDSVMAQSLDVALRFFVNLLAELQERQTGERHILCLA